jgi:hypothetical protein
VLVVLLAACESKPEVPAATPPVTKTQEPPKECTDLPFAPSTPVPEASGAAWPDVDGKPALFVISDSGNHGSTPSSMRATARRSKKARCHRRSAATTSKASPRAVVCSTSSRRRAGCARTSALTSRSSWSTPYALGPIDIEDKGGGMGDKPPKGTGMVCAAKHTNCGRNYEGRAS